MKRRLFLFAVLAIVMQITTVYAGRVGYVTTRPATAVAETPKNSLFSVDGSSLKFILLDVDEEGFFCTTKDFYGTQPFDPNGTGKFDIEDENNIAYWLNNDFLKDGGELWNNDKSDEKFIFPEKVLKYVKEHDWLCEAGYSTTDYSEDYIVRARLALMSVTEWKKYNGKVGYADNTNIAYYYWLRSVNGTVAPGDAAPVMVVSSGGTAQFGKVRNGYGVRPVFYLDRSFFTDVKLDISLMGANVKKVIRENFSDDELKRIYNNDEINEFHKKLPPQATTVTLTGVPQTGYVLEGKYTYDSPEGEAEFESEYRWLRSKNKNGPFSVIKGANETQFKIRDIDEGYYFVFEVTPKSKLETGTSVRSNATKTPAAKDIICRAENVCIDGKPEIGERLIARYNYYDGNRDVEDGTVIKWQISEDGAEFSDIEGAMGLNYVIRPTDEDKYIRFTIAVKSINSDEYGETVCSDIIGPVKASENTGVKTIVDNGTVRILTEVNMGADIPFWTVISADGEITIEAVGKTEYELRGTEASVKAGIFRTGNGLLGKIIYSDPIELQKSGEQDENAKKSVAVNGKTQVRLKCGGNGFAHSIKIHFALNGVKIENTDSESYNIDISEKEEGTVILTGLSKEQLEIPDLILNMELSGSGEIKIDSVEGVYEANGRIYKTVPNVFFE